MTSDLLHKERSTLRYTSARKIDCIGITTKRSWQCFARLRSSRLPSRSSCPDNKTLTLKSTCAEAVGIMMSSRSSLLV